MGKFNTQSLKKVTPFKMFQVEHPKGNLNCKVLQIKAQLSHVLSCVSAYRHHEHRPFIVLY